MDSLTFTEEYLRSIDIHTILPQQEPFVMVDNLIAFTTEAATTETVIRDTNIFVNDGYFSASGMMENIAQTCAARVGFNDKYILHKEVRVGFIGAVRNYTIHELAAVGSVIQTKIDILQDIFGMTLADAQVICDGKVIATAEIKLSVKNE